MKKLIILSIATSSLLFSANVDKLQIDQENSVNKSEINTAIIEQGKTQIIGNADVQNLSITSKDVGNLIDDSVVNASDDVKPHDPREDHTIITQGKTEIFDGMVTDTTINSDSVINNGTTVDAGAGERVNIDQGLTSVDGNAQVLTNAVIQSSNKISGVDIDGKCTSSTTVEQANFKMVDSGAGSIAQNIRISSENLIEDGKIDHATIKQAVTELRNGAFMDDIDVAQKNIINGETNILNFSEISQGVTKVTKSDVINLTQNVTNRITDVEGDSSIATNSKVVQADIKVHCDSILEDIRLNNKSTIKATDLKSSTVTQDTMDVHRSYVGNFGKKANNLVNKVDAYNSDIIQDSLIAKNSVVTGTQVSIQNNTVSRSELYNSHIDQANVEVTDSDVNRLTVCETNLVCDTKLCNANLSQGKVDISL